MTNAAQLNAELRYLQDIAVLVLALTLATSVEFGLAAASNLSRGTTATIATTTVVLGLIGYIVALVRRGFSDRDLCRRESRRQSLAR